MKKLLLLSTIMMLPWSESAYAVTVKVDDQPETAATTTTATTYTPQRQAPHLDENTKTLLKLMYEEKQLRKNLYNIEENKDKISNYNNEILTVPGLGIPREIKNINKETELLLIENLSKQLNIENKKFIKQEISNIRIKNVIFDFYHGRISSKDLFFIRNSKSFEYYLVLNESPFLTTSCVLEKNIFDNKNLLATISHKIKDEIRKYENERMRKLRKFDFSSVKEVKGSTLPQKPKEIFSHFPIEKIITNDCVNKLVTELESKIEEKKSIEKKIQRSHNLICYITQLRENNRAFLNNFSHSKDHIELFKIVINRIRTEIERLRGEKSIENWEMLSNESEMICSLNEKTVSLLMSANSFMGGNYYIPTNSKEYQLMKEIGEEINKKVNKIIDSERKKVEKLRIELYKIT